MSVSSISTSFAYAVQKVSSGGARSSTTAATQEANETRAQTAAEARNGDQVAVRKQSKFQQQHVQTPTTESGKGTSIDHKA